MSSNPSNNLPADIAAMLDDLGIDPRQVMVVDLSAIEPMKLDDEIVTGRTDDGVEVALHWAADFFGMPVLVPANETDAMLPQLAVTIEGVEYSAVACSSGARHYHNGGVATN